MLYTVSAVFDYTVITTTVDTSTVEEALLAAEQVLLDYHGVSIDDANDITFHDETGDVYDEEGARL